MTLQKTTNTLIGQMTVLVLSSIITSYKLTIMLVLELYAAFRVQY
jgi:hypothetical protein